MRYAAADAAAIAACSWAVSRVSTRPRRRRGASLAAGRGRGPRLPLYALGPDPSPCAWSRAATTARSLRVRERVAVKDRLFRLAAADVGELAHDLTSGRPTLRPRAVAHAPRGERRARRLAHGHPSSRCRRARRHGTASPRVRRAPPRSPRTRLATRSAPSAAHRTASAGFEFAVADGLFLAVGELKDLRRRAVAELDDGCASQRRHRPGTARAPAERRRAVPRRPPRSPRGGEAEVVLVRASGRTPAAGRRTSARCVSTCWRRTTPQAVAAAAARLGAAVCRCGCGCRRSCSTRTKRRGARSSPCRGRASTRATSVSWPRSPAPRAALLEYPLHGLNGLAPLVACAAWRPARRRRRGVAGERPSTRSPASGRPGAGARRGGAATAPRDPRLRPPAGAAHTRPAGAR